MSSRWVLASADRVLTPHPGEAGRLLGTDAASVQGDRVDAALRVADGSGAVVILKGYRTLIAGPGAVPIVNPTGNPGLASGGTGDVLTGLVAALVAQGLLTETAAWLGACLHGLAGDLAAASTGEPALVAGDVVEALPAAFAAARAGEWP